MFSGIVIKILLTAAVLTLCSVAALVLLHRFENPSNEFATYQDMHNSGLVQAGWIPKILPRSAVRIRETHNLDTNQVNIQFEFKPGDTAIAEQQCQRLTGTEEAITFHCKAGLLTLSSQGHGEFTSAHAP